MMTGSSTSAERAVAGAGRGSIVRTRCGPRPFGASGRRRRLDPQRSGIATLWTVLLLMLMIGIIGLAVDWGWATLVAHQLQNAADAAALAGALNVRAGEPNARDAATEIAADNHAAGQPVDLAEIVVGRWDRQAKIFRAGLTGRNAVKVVAMPNATSLNGQVQLFFGPVFGVGQVAIQREAIGMVGGGTGAGIIALNRTKKDSLLLNGNSVIHTLDGAIQVNSNDKNAAATLKGGAVVHTKALNVFGTPSISNNAQIDGPVHSGPPDVKQVPDPLILIPPPDYSGYPDRGTIWITGGTYHLDPGYYPRGITVTGGTVTLSPGIYVLDGAGLNISGNGTFTAQGVMFYVINDGKVDLTGTNECHITPPDPDLYSFPGVDTYERISIFQSRTNSNEDRIIGTSLMDLDGTLYFPAAPLKVGGTGDGFGTQLISDTIEIEGTADVTIRYDGREPAPGNRVFLVK